MLPPPSLRSIVGQEGVEKKRNDTSRVEQAF